MEEDSPDFFGHAFQVKAKERLLRDPLHGLIAIDESTAHGKLLVRLIDTAEVQRLRRIRQLGLAHYAYQGAEHSRFAHSIGAFHLTRRIVAQLERMYAIDSELAFFASTAALLHDIGHGPFSHVSEHILGLHHEEWTCRILHDPATEVNAVLMDYDRALPSVVESMLKGMARPGYLCSLVNSQLDADRLDYLLRDSLMTGVKYGVFDLDRLIHMLRIAPEGDKIIVAHGGLGPVEKYIQSRHHMYRQVYLHKTVAAAEAMLMALLRRAARLIDKDAKFDPEMDAIVRKAFSAPDSLTTTEYLHLDDTEILGLIKRWAGGTDCDPVLKDISARMLGRRLFKTIEVDPSGKGFEDRFETARGIIKGAGLDPESYLLRIESSDTPYRPYEPSSKKISSQIMVELSDGRIADVADVSPTIAAFTGAGYTLTRLAFPAEHEGHPIREPLAELFAGDVPALTK